MPHVVVPPPFRGPTAGQAEIEVTGATVLECLEALGRRFPGFSEQLFDEAGGIHGFVNLFVNGDEIDRVALDTALADGDRLEILAAIAGG